MPCLPLPLPLPCLACRGRDVGECSGMAERLARTSGLDPDAAREQEGMASGLLSYRSQEQEIRVECQIGGSSEREAGCWHCGHGQGLYREVPDADPPFVTYRRPHYGVAVKTTCDAVQSAVGMLCLALLLSGAGFLVWPASTEVVVKNIRLDGIDVQKDPKSSTLVPSLILHIAMELQLEIVNSNYFGVSYDTILVTIFYRGDEIGRVALERAQIPARRTVVVPAALDLQGQQIFKNVAALWADTLNRKIPFDTVTHFSGAVQVFSWRPHVKVDATCKVTVDPRDKIILAQSCSVGF